MHTHTKPGAIEMLHDRGSTYEFTNIVKELETAGVLFSDKRYTFDFTNIEKPYETYTGLNVRLRYFLRVTVTRNYAPNLVSEQDIVVQTTTEGPTENTTIKMEVGGWVSVSVCVCVCVYLSSSPLLFLLQNRVSTRTHARTHTDTHTHTHTHRSASKTASTSSLNLTSRSTTSRTSFWARFISCWCGSRLSIWNWLS